MSAITFSPLFLDAMPPVFVIGFGILFLLVPLILVGVLVYYVIKRRRRKS